VGRGSSHLNQFILDNNVEMGSNDLYVIKKLREAEITLEKIDAYLRKVYFSIKEGNGFTAVEAAE
jgi:DNA-binding transcriptional MerR regulator